MAHSVGKTEHTLISLTPKDYIQNLVQTEAVALKKEYITNVTLVLLLHAKSHHCKIFVVCDPRLEANCELMVMIWAILREKCLLFCLQNFSNPLSDLEIFFFL